MGEEQPYLYVTSESKVRGHDIHGSGHYGAGRGKRKHKGIDLVCEGGTMIMSACDGVVTRCKGIVYSDPKKSDWYYVEITDEDGMHNRFFYVKGLGIELQLKIKQGDVIGVAQGIEVLYEPCGSMIVNSPLV